jgi:hypothetical protein
MSKLSQVERPNFRIRANSFHYRNHKNPIGRFRGPGNIHEGRSVSNSERLPISIQQE